VVTEGEYPMRSVGISLELGAGGASSTPGGETFSDRLFVR
jgi:hypothetical protein